MKTSYYEKMATEAEARMTRFLSYDLTSAQNSYSSHKGWRGNALRAVQSRIHDFRTLRTPTSVTKLHEAIDKYSKKCGDIEVCIERLMVIDAINTAEYVKEIDNMTTERARLDKEVTDCFLVAPKETTPIRIEQTQETDKVKIRVDLKPETLTNDATPVEFRIWTKEFKVFFRSNNLWKGQRIEQQQALIKLIDSVLAAKLRGKIYDHTPVFTEAAAAHNMAGEAVPMGARPQGTSCFAILETHFQVSNPLFKRRSQLLKLKPSQGEQITSYMTRLKETLGECDLHNIAHKDVILLIATMHCNKEELRKDIKRYRNPTWLAVEQLAENYERSMVDEEPHKVGQVKRQDNKKKKNTDFILKSFTAHMGALSQRVDDNASKIASKAQAINGNRTKAEENEDNIRNLTARVRTLEQAPHHPPAPTVTRATLSQEYLLARRSIRMWPIAGGTDTVLWEGVGDFIHDSLCMSTKAVGQDDIKAVNRVLYTASGAPNRLEVLVTFFDKGKRDLVVSHATNLASRVDSEGRPTAGIRLEIPHELDDMFRLLSRFGTRLRARHGAGTKRHIKFDDFAGSLYTNIKLPGDTSWTRVSPETAKEDLLASVREEALFTRKRLASKLVQGPRERLVRPLKGHNTGQARSIGQALTSSASAVPSTAGLAGRRPRWSRPDQLPPVYDSGAGVPSKKISTIPQLDSESEGKDDSDISTNSETVINMTNMNDDNCARYLFTNARSLEPKIDSMIECKSNPLSYTNSGDIFIFNSNPISEFSQLFIPIFQAKTISNDSPSWN